MDLPESQNSRDARIEELWKKLDPHNKREIDLKGLERGLKRIDHPLKNAHDMLKDIVKAIDKNGDQIIQYEEFRTFVEQTERELFSLFQSIDKDGDGKLDKGELQAAFKRAGMTVPSSKLNQFFSEIDGNHDGYISFDEWRNFLLFLPTNTQTPALKAVLSYYSSAVSLNSEGDTSIREDTLEGLGRSPTSFLTLLFGAIINIAAPSSISSFPATTQTTTSSEKVATDEAEEIANGKMYEGHHAHFTEGVLETKQDNRLSLQSRPPVQQEEPEELEEETFLAPTKKSLLTQVLPDPGYFAAGGLAGVISRTATAPLDRLKVYLIANVGSNNDPVAAMKRGDTTTAARQVGRPLILACRELWNAGGMRSLFAGNGLNVLKVMPESAIKFGSYEAAKRALAHLEGHGDPQNINPYSKFVAGGVGGLVSQLVVYPIDTLKFRMQCETVSGGLHGNKLIIATWKKMYNQGGIRASYRGLTMGLIGMFPYSAIDLGTFEFLKTSLARRNAKLMGCHEDDALPGSFATGCIGAFSGAFGASVVYPVNLLRTRLQAQGTVLHPPTYTGIWDVARKTVKNEGVRGLFKGITPNLLKVVPAVSITYVVYENAKKALNLR